MSVLTPGWHAIGPPPRVRAVQSRWERFWIAGCLACLPTAFCCVHAAAPPLTWQQGEGHRFRPVSPVVNAARTTGFTRLPGEETGLVFSNVVEETRGIDNRNLLSGSGVAAGDVDGDGWCDLYFCGMDPANALYRNLGNWRFEDITAASGTACEGQDSTGAVFADVDGDADLDLLVNSFGHGVRMFANDGQGRFTEKTEEAGLASRSGGTSLALADVDGDGDLDLYVVNYRTTTIMDRVKTTFQILPQGDRFVVASVDGVPTTHRDLTNRFVMGPAGNVIELAEPDILFRNDGTGRFTPVSWTDGSFLDEQGRPYVDAPREWGLAAQFHDVNGDLAPDFYVCNDLFSPDRFWINDGQGRFRAADLLAVRTTSTFSMGIDFGDLDRDGAVDFMVVDMLGTSHKDRHTQVSTERPIRWPIGVIDNIPQVWRNTLQRNRGDATFEEISFYAGIEASNWSWMPLLLDIDLDGYEDLIVPNGQLLDVQNVDMQRRIEAERAGRELSSADIRRMVAMFPDFRTPNLVFRNRGDLTFEDMQGQWGFTEVGISQGTVTADLDNDGDLDLATNNLQERAALHRNEAGGARLAVRLKGRRGNPDAIGANIVVHGGPTPQSKEVIAGGHYLSGADSLCTFAAGSATNRLRIEVTWRDGSRTEIAAALANHVYEITQPEPENSKPAPPPPASPPPLFADVTPLLQGHRHHEDDFDDFSRQPLLLRKLSQLGPGVAWHDLNGDGWEDLVIGTGRGGALGVFENTTAGAFRQVTSEVVSRPAARDTTTVLGLGNTLVLGAANYEDGQTNGGCLRIFQLDRNASGDSVLGQKFSTGPLALADVDRDGMLDLFVGGRCVAGRYPESPSSLLLLNRGGRFSPVQVFDDLGMVSGAVFSDLDGDGTPELVCACEWGRVRILRWSGQRYDDVTKELGMWPLTGWWTGVTSGDFDSDGRMDLVAGNWGFNTRLGRPTAEYPQVLLHGDLDESGVVQLIDASYKPEINGLGPDRGYLAVAQAMPFLQETVPTFDAYGTRTIEAIYGDWLQSAQRLEATTFASTLFLNRGDHFDARPLPGPAQISPAFGLSVADLDGDGHEDLFLSQNFFAVAIDETRCDAGRGLLLQGDGKGGFTEMPGSASGIKVYGEQRGCALGDYDHDGRPDLVVTQNGAATRLFRNQGGKAGLRVRLIGGKGNPFAIGAVLRLGDQDHLGPARELHAGAGYWSSDSPVPVMTFADGMPTRLWVRWPGGPVTESVIPVSAAEIAVSQDGSVAVLVRR